MTKPYPKSKQLKKEEDDDKPSKLGVSSDDLARCVLHWWRRYYPGCSLAVEVGLGDGSRRRADAILLRYRRGPIGFELKTSRSDWLRELAEPKKHKPLLDLAGQLFFVSPNGVILEHEIPDGTGLYWANPLSGGLKLKAKADRRSPSPITWEQAAKLANGVLRAVERGIT